jgi:methionyl-tRNA formyltransferase
LAEAGAELLVQTLPAYVAGDLATLAQDEGESTYVPMLRKEQGHIDWQRSAEEIERQCRAYDPWPGCYTYWDSRLVKLLAVRALPEWSGSVIAGTVTVGGDWAELIVLTGRGALAIDRLQVEGKRPVSAGEFLRGQRGIVGTVLR